MFLEDFPIHWDPFEGKQPKSLEQLELDNFFLAYIYYENTQKKKSICVLAINAKRSLKPAITMGLKFCTIERDIDESVSSAREKQAEKRVPLSADRSNTTQHNQMR